MTKPWATVNYCENNEHGTLREIRLTPHDGPSCREHYDGTLPFAKLPLVSAAHPEFGEPEDLVVWSGVRVLVFIGIGLLLGALALLAVD